MQAETAARAEGNLGPAFAMSHRSDGMQTSAADHHPGALLVMPMDANAQLAYRGLDEFRSLTLSCDRQHLEQVASHAGLPWSPDRLAPSCNGEADPQSVFLSQAIVQELRAEQGLPLLLETLTIALTAHILRRTAGMPAAPKRQSAGLAPHVMNRVTGYMQEHLQEPLSLDALAAVAGLSSYHFCRMFRQSAGMPPHQYLAQARIARAKQLLRLTTRPIGDIGFETGVGSASQFSHFFKKWMQCTPQEYRRRSHRIQTWSMPGLPGKPGLAMASQSSAMPDN